MPTIIITIKLPRLNWHYLHLKLSERESEREFNYFVVLLVDCVLSVFVDAGVSSENKGFFTSILLPNSAKPGHSV